MTGCMVLLVGSVVGCGAPRSYVELNTAAIYPNVKPLSECRLEVLPDAEFAVGHVVVVTLSERRTVRRIVGLEGDAIAVRSGVLFRNGESAQTGVVKAQTLCLAGISPRCRCRITTEGAGERVYKVQALAEVTGEADARCMGPPEGAEITVPKGHAYLLADNRDAARDSRHVGPVLLSRLEARVLACKK